MDQIVGVQSVPSRAGSPNKPKRALLALLQEKYPGYHPVVEMAKIAHDPNSPMELKAQMHKEVSQYVEPKRRAVDVQASVSIDGELRLKYEQALESLSAGE